MSCRPSWRVLVPAILTAAEDAEDITTTQDLPDRIRVLSTHEDVELAHYDPDGFAERTLFEPQDLRRRRRHRLPLAFVLTPGQAADCPRFQTVLNQACLRRRRTTAVIPEIETWRGLATRYYKKPEHNEAGRAGEKRSCG